MKKLASGQKKPYIQFPPDVAAISTQSDARQRKELDRYYAEILNGMGLQRAVRATRDNPYLFQAVKDSVDIVEAARHYGLEPDRNGWCRCPFHGEKTPSFHLYRQRGKCFGCGWSGDVIDLAAGIRGTGPLEAVKELNQMFRLGIDLDAPVDTAEVVRARLERQERERFRTWREEAVQALTDRFRTLHQARIFGAAYAAPGALSDRYAAALKEIDKVEYYLDLVCSGEDAEIKAAMPVINQAVARIRGEAGAS